MVIKDRTQTFEVVKITIEACPSQNTNDQDEQKFYVVHLCT